MSYMKRLLFLYHWLHVRRFFTLVPSQSYLKLNVTYSSAPQWKQHSKGKEHLYIMIHSLLQLKCHLLHHRQMTCTRCIMGYGCICCPCMDLCDPHYLKDNDSQETAACLMNVACTAGDMRTAAETRRLITY